MSDYEKPPIGSPEWRQLNIAPSTKREGKRNHKRIDERTRVDNALYDEFKSRLDILHLKSIGKYDSHSRESQVLTSASLLQDLSGKTKDYLRLNSRQVDTSGVLIFVYNDGEADAWISVSKEDRRIKFIFDRNEQNVSAQMQARDGTGWVDVEKIDNAMRDVDKVLSLTESLTLVKSSGAA
ncbi:hypothetical protein IID22_00095 [Patescibacteria group bacterium]|nr:hypothetical protein [Patescibacteria group bacterium]